MEKREIKFLDYFSLDLHKDNTKSIFVFGSNTAGRHGAGAALIARKFWGAKNGTGEGFTGSSYALPTKDSRLNTLPLKQIKKSVELLKKEITNNPDLVFLITPVGTGLAGYNHSDIAPMFKDFPENCVFTSEWRYFL